MILDVQRCVKSISMLAICHAIVQVSSCICCRALARSFCSSSHSVTRNIWHREHHPNLETSSDLDVLIAKVSKGSSDNEIFQFLVHDKICDAIQLSHSLIDRLLHRFKDDWKSALGIFRWANSRPGFRHLPKTYDMMVDILGQMRQMDKVRDLLDEMYQGNLITLNTIAKVMRRFAGAGLWEDAVRIFDELQTLGLEKNTESMNLLLDTLCKENKVQQARTIFLELKQHILPDAHTFNIFIHGWCKISRVEEAHWTIQEMKGYGFHPCVISYSTIIQCYCEEQNFSRVYELLDEMQAQGCCPNVVTFTTIMCALAKAEKFEEALQIVEIMNSVACRPDTLFYNSLIHTLGRAGRVNDAIYVFKVEMPKTGISPNTSTYNSIISMFCHHAQENKAVDTLKEMEASGLCKPDIQTYHPLIKLCFKTGKIDSCLNHILNDMINKQHLCPDISTYTLLIHGFCRANKCEQAYFLFEEMIVQDIMPRYRTCCLLLNEVKRKNMHRAAETIEDLMKKL